MRYETIRLIEHLSKYWSLCLLAAAICLSPAAAQAQATPRIPIEAANTATGVGALTNLAGGVGYNTATGYIALNQTTTGQSNTANGAHTLRYNTTGSNSVAVGTYALFSINGSNNIALGANAGKRTTAGNRNIYIGHVGINGNESRVMRIGQTQTKTFIAGIAGTALSGATVVVRSNGQLGVVASSARYKQDIKPLQGAAEKLAQLRPVSYRYKSEPQATHYGLIAEEVDKVMPELVVRDGESKPESVQYLELVPLLLQQWKAQRELNAQQQAENAQQRTEITRLRALIERQQAALTEIHRTLAVRLAEHDQANVAKHARSQ
jgi:hypothetical protein